MTTARDIITRAMQKIGVLTKGEPPSADEVNDALNSLNMLISSWSNDSNTIYARTRDVFNIPFGFNAGVNSYNIGTGQTLNTSRPSQIIEGYVTSGGIDYPLSTITDEQYDLISLKTNSGIPAWINYNNNYPTGIIRVYPTPDKSYQLTLASEKPVASILTLDTVISLPDGWERALIYNLALELAPEYGAQPDASIVKIAADALGKIRVAVIRARSMDAYPKRFYNKIWRDGWLS